MSLETQSKEFFEDNWPSHYCTLTHWSDWREIIDNEISCESNTNWSSTTVTRTPHVFSHRARYCKSWMITSNCLCLWHSTTSKHQGSANGARIHGIFRGFHTIWACYKLRNVQTLQQANNWGMWCLTLQLKSVLIRCSTFCGKKNQWFCEIYDLLVVVAILWQRSPCDHCEFSFLLISTHSLGYETNRARFLFKVHFDKRK